MHLTLVNFFKRTVPGHIFRGKKRLVREVTRSAMNKLINDYERTENNMLLLRHPFITLEQSQGHAKDLMKREKKIEFFLNNPIKPPFKPHVRIEDRLIHLRVKEVWD